MKTLIWGRYILFYSILTSDWISDNILLSLPWPKGMWKRGGQHILLARPPDLEYQFAHIHQPSELMASSTKASDRTT